jgi:hypothetical protein
LDFFFLYYMRKLISEVIMKVRIIIAGLLICVAVSFAQSSDTTNKSVAPQTTTVSTVTENKQLKKAKVIKAPTTTTWSKIKDLFM